MEGLTEGRIVHYIPFEWDRFQNPSEHRPAIVVKVWPGGDAPNLIVFVDGMNDMPPTGPIPAGIGEQPMTHTVWRTSVRHSEAKEPGTWHWIEKA